MFKRFDTQSGRRARPGDAATLLLSVAVHVIAIALLVRLSLLHPPRKWTGEQIALVSIWMDAPHPEPAPEQRAPRRAIPSPAPPKPDQAPATGFIVADPHDPPPEIPTVNARLALASDPEREALAIADEEPEWSAPPLFLDSVTASVAPPFDFPVDGVRRISYPRLRNRDFIVEMLARRYPWRLAFRGISSEVTLRFVIDERGVVDPASIRLVASDREEFALLALTIAQRLRFWPAKYGNQAVPIAIQMPIRWQPGS